MRRLVKHISGVFLGVVFGAAETVGGEFSRLMLDRRCLALMTPR